MKLMIKSETLTEKDDWSIEELTRLEKDHPLDNTTPEEAWFVLRNGGESGQLSVPFDSVNATGSLIILSRNGQTTGVVSGALTGMNEYNEESDIPQSIVLELHSIGPW